MFKKINIMGGECYLKIITKKEKYETEIFNFLFSELNNLVNTFNFFDKNSKLSKLNSEQIIKYDKNLAFLLKESIKFYKITNSKFNIFIGNEISQIKSNQKPKRDNLEKLELNNILSISKTDDFIKINYNNIKIDLGGIAKGFIVDQVIEKTIKKFKNEIKTIIFDGRGDIRVYSNKNEIIEIENPFDKNNSFEEIKLKKGSIITSGINKQKFKFGNHILGENKDIFTITLISEKLKTYELDAFGTYLIQLKSNEVLEIIEFEDIFKDIECLLVLNNGKILTSSFWNGKRII